MFARRDQENLSHVHRQAAASKPLNQQGAPKTPGPKGGADAIAGRHTIKKHLIDDENAPFTFGKGRKALGNDVNAFVTPGPRDRAPLGAKTTNAKSKPFQTPAALTTQQQPRTVKTKQRSASARKPKLKIHHQPEELLDVGPIGDVKQDLETDDGEVPDIEYAPAKLPDLPDYPDPDDPLELRADEDFEMFSKENYMRNAFQHFYNPIGDDGVSRLERKAKKEAEADERYFARMISEAAMYPPETDMEREWRLEEEMNEQAPQKGRDAKSKGASVDMRGSNEPVQASRMQQRKPPVGTLTARSAASALSSRRGDAPTRSTMPTSKPKSGFAAPTVASAARKHSATSPDVSEVEVRKRGTPGTIASRTTIGYASGRKVSAARKREQRDGSTSGLCEDDKAFLRRRREERERSEELMSELVGAEPANGHSNIVADPLAYLWQDADGGLDDLDDQLKDVHLDPAMFGVD